jgi:endonuclease/exonuclease/phosphatase (EEP) superfamily protein YafD
MTPRLSRQKAAIPAYIAAGVGVIVVVALPLLARFVDGSADEFNGRTFAIATAFGWLICAALFSVVLTRWLQLLFSVKAGPVMALAYDALPILLVGAWLVLILALLSGHWLLATAAASLSAFHLALVIPRTRSAHLPHWTRHAPTLDLVVANVFVDNETPHEAARQLVAADADLIVLVESTKSFLHIFDEVGGAVAYPHRVTDPDDDSDYAVTIATKLPLGPRTAMKRIGPLCLAIADVEVEDLSTLVIAVNPMATVDPSGHDTWKEQINVLKEFVPTLQGPVIIAGDLNTTQYRPEFQELLALGLSDAIDSLGKGLNASFKLRATGVLGSIGAVARLDHALVNEHLHATAISNLEPCGSDHLPFRLTVAVRSNEAHASESHASEAHRQSR